MSKKNVAGHISYVMIIMILSRLLSLLSTQVYMSFFGTDSDYINIYSYAISVPNIIFTCFGTALSTVVIPIYAGYEAKGEADKSKRFADNIITVSMVITAVIVVIGIALSPVLPKLTSFKASGESYSFAVKSLMIMMPVMFFYGLNYIFQGMLQSKGKYGWPAFVSVPSSLVVIFYVLFLGDKFGVPGLLGATVIGLSLQALILIPPLVKTGYRYKPVFDLRDKDIISAGKMTGPVLIGVSAYQLNMFYNVTMMANFEGMVTLLTYVQNIVLYMVLAFVYSITAVIYPRLTASAALGNMDEYKETLSNILNTVILLLIPVTVGFISVRTELLELIAQWGKITEENIKTAANLLMLYSIGILGIGLKEILDRAFYALKNTLTPAINGFIIMGINIALSLVLIKYIGKYGIPLAYSVASLVGMCVLLYMLRRRIGKYGKGLALNLIKSIVSSAVMFAAVYFTRIFCLDMFCAGTLADRLIKLALPCICGVIVYAVMMFITGVPMAKDILNKLRRRV